jgi:hypothetical protein
LHTDTEHDGRHDHRQKEERADRAAEEKQPVTQADRGRRAERGGQQRGTRADDQAVDDRPPPGIGKE